MDPDFAPEPPELPPLHEHPVYIEGMEHLKVGQWPEAFKLFQMLQGIYPDHAEVEELLNKVRMRATMVQFRPRPSSRTPKRFNIRRFLIGILVLVIVGIAAYVAYALWINPVLVQEIRVRQVTSLRTKADEAIAAGDFAQARQALQELQVILPEDPDTIETLRQVERVERMSGLYSQAKALMAQGSWDQAIEALTELQSLDAQYRDLSQLLQEARESQALDSQFQAAEAAFAGGDWASAVAQYEALQQADLTFRFDDVQARLFESHQKYGQTLLAAAGTDPDRVAEVLSHFSEALKLSPLDEEVLNERRLAENYLAALDAEDQDEVIELLQAIYDQQPEYADREVARLLYITLLERAASLLEAGDKAAAVADYEAAARLLVDDPSEAQEKLVELASETP